MYATITPELFADKYCTVDRVFSRSISNKTDLCMSGKKLSESAVLPGSFHVTEKLDGVRCIAFCDRGGVILMSRNGNMIRGCLNVRLEIIHMGFNGVLDGELIAVPLPGESRKRTYERTRADLQAGRGEMRFHVFDVLSCDEYCMRQSVTPYIQRRAALDDLSKRLSVNSPVQVVPVLYHGQDVEKARRLMRDVVGRGGEGVMVNLSSAAYEFRRTSVLLKLKPVNVVDLRIVDVLPGTGRNTGKAGAIVVDYCGERVGVSSGLSDGLRKAIFANPEKYIGRVASVRYAEESANAAGKVSLRFPSFVEVREIGKEPSFD